MEGEEVLPHSLTQILRDEAVTCGWLRASGVLEEVELRAYGSDIRGQASERRIAGPVQAVVIEGSIGLADGDVSFGLRAVLARETDRGLEAIAGEIVSANVVALEGVVTVLHDVAMSRALDPDAGIWFLLDGTMQEAPTSGGRENAPTMPTPAVAHPSPVPPPVPPARPPAQATPAWSDAIAASRAAGPVRSPQPPRYNLASPPGTQPIPPRPVRPSTGVFDEGPFPEEGDLVEHFAFGTCDVIKSDGERLHLRVHKDGRLKEIALEMLKVTLLTTDGDTRRYRLDRKL